MLVFQIIIFSVLIAYAFVVFVFLLANKALIKTLTLNCFIGITLLLILKLLENLIKIKIYINIVSVLSALILGPVGVFLNLLLSYIIF